MKGTKTILKTSEGYTPDLWFDSNIQSWTLRWLDSCREQIGECEYAYRGNKQNLLDVINERCEAKPISEHDIKVNVASDFEDRCYDEIIRINRKIRNLDHDKLSTHRVVKELNGEINGIRNSLRMMNDLIIDSSESA